MITMAIDPGSTHSSYVTLMNGIVMNQGDLPNEEMASLVSVTPVLNGFEIACEMVAHYGQGMPAGKDVFDTCRWIGRFEQAAFQANVPFHLVYRMQVKMHLCGNVRAKDSNIRQALIDLLGPPGTKKNPGPTYGVSGHRWQALALGITWESIRPKEAAA